MPQFDVREIYEHDGERLPKHLSDTLKRLAESHMDAIHPLEPYSQGIGLLWNADHMARSKADATKIREEWVIVSPYILERVTQLELVRDTDE